MIIQSINPATGAASCADRYRRITVGRGGADHHMRVPLTPVRRLVALPPEWIGDRPKYVQIALARSFDSESRSNGTNSDAFNASPVLACAQPRI